MATRVANYEPAESAGEGRGAVADWPRTPAAEDGSSSTGRAKSNGPSRRAFAASRRLFATNCAAPRIARKHSGQFTPPVRKSSAFPPQSSPSWRSAIGRRFGHGRRNAAAPIAGYSLPPQPIVAVLEGIEKPGNLVRSCAAPMRPASMRLRSSTGAPISTIPTRFGPAWAPCFGPTCSKQRPRRQSIGCEQRGADRRRPTGCGAALHGRGLTRRRGDRAGKRGGRLERRLERRGNHARTAADAAAWPTASMCRRPPRCCSTKRCGSGAASSICSCALVPRADRYAGRWPSRSCS